ncbi:MAG: hypothetical protein K0S08_988 [Gammaproteobacteria bacterium]|jgi:hypothetical protein|nr:hypothetical protein [Gammaproteobacteria bacterium]
MKLTILTTALIAATLINCANAESNFICNRSNPALKLATDATTVAGPGYEGVFIPIKQECNQNSVCQYQIAVGRDDEAIQPHAYNHSGKTSWVNGGEIPLDTEQTLYAFASEDGAGQCVFKSNSGLEMRGNLTVKQLGFENTKQTEKYWEEQGIHFN